MDLNHLNRQKEQVSNIVLEYMQSVFSGVIKEQYEVDGIIFDYYIPDKQIAIDVREKYSSSSLYQEKKFHLERSKKCQELQIRLITIFDWEITKPDKWSKIKMLLQEALGCSQRIYARQCEIREITNQQAKMLNDMVHLQGHRHARVTYGLFYQDTLVQLMSFSKTKYNRNLKGEQDWEIIRGCPGSNTSVIGGVSKLFKHFIRKHNPDKVFSYCDFNKFNGRSYELIGMRCIGYSGPDKTWLVDGEAIPRNTHRYKELKEKAEAIVWGSGSKKYEWVKESL